jgi:hypothetical protein
MSFMVQETGTEFVRISVMDAQVERIRLLVMLACQVALAVAFVILGLAASRQRDDSALQR